MIFRFEIWVKKLGQDYHVIGQRKNISTRVRLVIDIAPKGLVWRQHRTNFIVRHKDAQISAGFVTFDFQIRNVF
jgi:hypothetical protein